MVMEKHRRPLLPISDPMLPATKQRNTESRELLCGRHPGSAQIISNALMSETVLQDSLFMIIDTEHRCGGYFIHGVLAQTTCYEFYYLLIRATQRDG